MTAEELLSLNDEPNRHELIKGELLTMSPTGGQHGSIAGGLTAFLGTYIMANSLGEFFVGNTGFNLESNPDTVLAPDFAFVARPRTGMSVPGFIPGAPDLAVEVLSSGDTKPEVERKTALWLDLGAKSVWNVNPLKRTVEVVRANGERRVFKEADELVDEIVPGFRVKVSEIFK